MQHIDLFTGIGGFSLACEWAGIETILFCENDKFCQRVLKKNWPLVPIIEDVNDKEEIKRIVADTYSKREQQPEGINEELGGWFIDRNQQATSDTRCQRQAKREEQTTGIIERDEVTTDSTEQGLQELKYYHRDNAKSETQTRTRLDNRPERCDSLLLTAGFPCQPFSGAGKRKGSSDDRYLWPQTFAVIESVKPDWVILENVAGLLSMVFPDNATNVANQTSLFGNQDEEIADFNTICGRIDSDLRQAGYETVWLVIPACSLSAPHRRDRVWIFGNAEGNSIGKVGRVQKGQTANTRGSHRPIKQVASPDSESEQKHATGERGLHSVFSGADRAVPDWRENWYEVAARFCRVDARVSDRVDRLKSLGNAIVPQVAYQIIKSIQEAQ